APARRRAAETGRILRGRCCDPGDGRWHDRQGARGDEDATAAPGAHHGVGGDRRSQPLFHWGAPWALAKTDPARQGTVLYVTAEVIRQVAVLAQPFMPKSAAKLLDLLAVPAEERLFRELGGARRIAGGTPLPPPSPVFPRYVDSEGSAQS